ncbi:MAG: DNA-directed RNA polymerase subunit D [Candidatus Aenigmatarchaeota archaeon]|nr:MAG: DNA-directed RNA polymerase subunit D [Candidatus Aenigmarchaeota archaeon]
MKIKIISRKGGNLRFLLDNATPAFANALRRVMLSEIPNLTIDIVDFEDNTSALFDEIIAHRLGMLPLQFDPKKFNFHDECRCKGKGCSLCEVFFSLEKTGPAMVHSSDIKSSNRGVKPTSPDFPIVELLKNQHIKFEAIARLGRGKNHAKFQSANVSYTYLPVIEVSQAKDLKRIVKSCPKGVLGIKNRKLVLLDPYKCDECNICEEAGGGNVKIKSDPAKFVFSVESISGLEPKYIVEESSRILQEKAKEFKDQLRKVRG